MTRDDDRPVDAYLWDPAAEPSPEIESVERRLAGARFDPVRHPLQLPPSRVARRGYARPLLALAASLILLAAGASAFWSWRWNWPAGEPWRMTVQRAAGDTAPVVSQLQVDQPLRLDPVASARVNIARIGTMRVAPGTALTLAETTSRRHRVFLDRGAVSVRVWAPPGRFAFSTPAGNVIDLGCVFELSVDAEGTSEVRVDTGWVQLENGWGESLVPAGAASIMRAAARPGVPVYDDALAAFRTSVRAFERADGEAARGRMIDGVVSSARPRDVLTLLTLANASPAPLKRPLLVRAAQLFPPPAAVSVEAIVAGDRDQLWRWYEALDLPPAKSWWLNWRDALPAGLTGTR
ncbi:MAG TPA: hypothetical protein VJ813_03230 [Vicinamibacterales bacterium]|nr:hypothetical protein [Vicinamibacterales bacterium]